MCGDVMINAAVIYKLRLGAVTTEFFASTSLALGSGCWDHWDRCESLRASSWIPLFLLRGHLTALPLFLFVVHERLRFTVSFIRPAVLFGVPWRLTRAP